jgi:peroxidase
MLTQLFTTFAQFVDHDITFTAAYTVPDCCSPNSDDEECAPITVTNDPFYGASKCLNFARSIAFCEELGCSTDPLNGITGYVDGSQIYGSDSGNATQLRALTGGRLAISKIAPSDSAYMPVVDGAFKAGDTRALENPALSSIQTLFLREHNRIAQLIQNRFPTWTDEKIYQHTRRIVIAELQNIVFAEMVPQILGDAMFPLPLPTLYNPNVDASIVNEFSTAAYRFGHSLLNGKFDRRDPSTGSLLDSYLLRFNFNNDTVYKQDPGRGMTSIVKGLTAQYAQQFDQFFTKEVTQFLFSLQSDNFLFGEDLVSRNLQRGRDHSLQPWLSYRKWCGLPGVDDWNQPPQDISLDKWNTLRSLYNKVSDIDLFTGGLSERPISRAVVGPTFACIISKQFQNFMYGDRHFFTHANNVGSQFNPNQVNALVKVRISDIICQTTNIRDIQRQAFLQPSPVGGPNPLVSCSNAYSIDINSFFGKFQCTVIAKQKTSLT